MTSGLGETWDRRFSEQQWPSTPDIHLVEFAGALPPGRGLDLGAGPGRNSLWLAAKGWAMTLVDISRIGLDQAARAAQNQGTPITPVQADVTAWRAQDADFDLAIVANLHLGTQTLTVVLDKAARALRQGGHLYVVGRNISSVGRHGRASPERLFTEERLLRTLPPDLKVDVLGTRDRMATDRTSVHQPSADRVVLAWTTKLSSSIGST